MHGYPFKKGREKHATEYREFETLILEVDVITRFSVEALRLLEIYKDGVMQSQALAFRLQMKLPFLVAKCDEKSKNDAVEIWRGKREYKIGQTGCG